MKLHLANFAHQNVFTGYGDSYVQINQTRYEKSLIVLPDFLIDDWLTPPVSQLEIPHFQSVLLHTPEIIILGTGAKLQFPDHSLLSNLVKLGIGIEVMATKACCRTYNILAEEGRRVAAAIFIENC